MVLFACPFPTVDKYCILAITIWHDTFVSSIAQCREITLLGVILRSKECTLCVEVMSVRLWSTVLEAKPSGAFLWNSRHGSLKVVQFQLLHKIAKKKKSLRKNYAYDQVRFCAHLECLYVSRSQKYSKQKLQGKRYTLPAQQSFRSVLPDFETFRPKLKKPVFLLHMGLRTLPVLRTP